MNSTERGGAKKGFGALLATAILWGSSFPAIKVVVSSVGGLTYTWLRGALSLLSLSPYVAFMVKRGKVGKRLVLGGLATGAVYAIALWLQGWGMEFTSASNAAFITGLNVVFVHIHTALAERSYGLHLATSLVLSVLGLYALTTPSGGFGLGEFLVLISAVFWAIQILLVSEFGGEDPIAFAFFEVAPTLSFFVPDAVLGLPALSHEILMWSLYLALACSDAAFALQAFGQRYVSPATSAILLLSEPVFASIFAYLLLGEVMTPVQALGASLIIFAMLTACLAEARREQVQKGIRNSSSEPFEH